jgi:hypothetical protein
LISACGDNLHEELDVSGEITRNELLWRIMEGAVLIRYNHESVQKTTRAVLKRAGLYIANKGRHFEQHAAQTVVAYSIIQLK